MVGWRKLLIHSVVQAIPTYSMALFKLPKGLCDHITSMVRKFWWGSKNGERKLAWVAWDDMTMRKYRGGLDSRDIEIFNLALLARHVWKILNEPGSLSARILKSANFPSSDILSARLGSQPSQIWCSLCEGRDILRLGLIHWIGDGQSTGSKIGYRGIIIHVRHVVSLANHRIWWLNWYARRHAHGTCPSSKHTFRPWI
jgi:hypothetical protein